MTICMSVPFRTAVMMIAALTASSVAPARSIGRRAVIAENSNDLPVEAAPAVLPVEEALDPLAPVAEEPNLKTNTIEPGATLAENRRQAAQQRRWQPRTRMPRRRHLLRVQERESRRSARRRPCHCQPRLLRPFPVKLLRRCLSTQPVQLRPRTLDALHSAGQPGLEGRGSDRQDRRASASPLAGGQGDVLHARRSRVGD